MQYGVLTTQDAQRMLLDQAFSGQRAINRETKIKYGLLMWRRTFPSNTIITRTVRRLPEGLLKYTIMNGHHRLNALASIHDPAFSYGFWFHDIPIDLEDDNKPEYALHDRNRPRSLGNMFDAVDLAAATGLNKAQTVQLSACLPLLASGFEATNRGAGVLKRYTDVVDTRMAFVHLWKEECQEYWDLIKGTSRFLSPILRISSVMAVALVLLHHTGQDAHDFCRDVAHDDGLSQYNPRKKLHEFLITTAARHFEPYLLSRYIAAAWNASWQERDLRNLVPQPGSNPMRLEGTPHNGHDIYRYLRPDGRLLKDPIRFEASAWDDVLPHDRHETSTDTD